MFTNLRVWFRHQRVMYRMRQNLVKRVGVSEAGWPQATPVQTVLEWFDTQLAHARRPYGHLVVKIVVHRRDVDAWSFDQIVTAGEWPAVRAELAAHLATALPKTSISTGTIALSSAWGQALNEELA